jgi:hypothetical protein
VWKGVELIDVRGSQQFKDEIGGILYAQIRPLIVRFLCLPSSHDLSNQRKLCLCVQHGYPVPPALVSATYSFENGSIRQEWLKSEYASPASMSVISFQLVNLGAAIRQGQITDPAEIRERAMAIDGDLQAWASVLPAHWEWPQLPERVNGGIDYDASQFKYSANTWLAEIQNTYRSLRIVALRLVGHDRGFKSDDESVARIRDLSDEICCSVAIFDNVSRASASSPVRTQARTNPWRVGALSVLRPLMVVFLAETNPVATRRYAAQALLRVGKRLGVKNAMDVAELVLGHLGGESMGGPERLDYDTVPIAATF